jgi:hypothetical protein
MKTVINIYNLIWLKIIKFVHANNNYLCVYTAVSIFESIAKCIYKYTCIYIYMFSKYMCMYKYVSNILLFALILILSIFHY